MTRLEATALAALAVLGAGALAGCESTQDKSARLARENKGGRKERGLVVTKVNPDVKVGTSTVLRDRNGAALVVELTSRASRPLVRVPLSFSIRGRDGKELASNAAPGLDPALTHVPLLTPGRSFAWVDNQVQLAAPAKDAAVKVGSPDVPTAATLPRVALTRPTLTIDPVDGPVAKGFVANRSEVAQRDLVVYCVARRSGRVVAAGRALITSLAPGKRARYSIFFIGDPRGAKLSLSAPPTVLE